MHLEVRDGIKQKLKRRWTGRESDPANDIKLGQIFRGLSEEGEEIIGIVNVPKKCPQVAKYDELEFKSYSVSYLDEKCNGVTWLKQIQSLVASKGQMKVEWPS